MERKRADSTDILLLLEGTFPYVRGGVSSWVKRMIEGFPEQRFGIIFLGSAKSDYGRSQPYPLPENVDYFAEYFLYDDGAPLPVKVSGKSALDAEPIHHAHLQMRACLQAKCRVGASASWTQLQPPSHLLCSRARIHRQKIGTYESALP